MKKVVLTIIVAVFLCLMALCVGAKTITTASNQTESSAVSIEFGDTGVIYGQLNYDDVRFYKLTIPYNGGLTISGRLTCDKKTPNINATYYFYIYNSANDLGEQMLSFKTSASTDCSSKMTISIPKGTYVVRIDDGFYKPDNNPSTAIRWSPSPYTGEALSWNLKATHLSGFFHIFTSIRSG